MKILHSISIIVIHLGNWLGMTLQLLVVSSYLWTLTTNVRNWQEQNFKTANSVSIPRDLLGSSYVHALIQSPSKIIYIIIQLHYQTFGISLLIIYVLWARNTCKGLRLYIVAALG